MYEDEDTMKANVCPGGNYQICSQHIFSAPWKGTRMSRELRKLVLRDISSSLVPNHVQ